jgi:putative endonuclease
LGIFYVCCEARQVISKPSKWLGGPQRLRRWDFLLRGSFRNGTARNAIFYEVLIFDSYDSIMYFVYILLGEKDHRTYVGYSNNVMARLKRHNAGHVAATKNRRPLRILFYEKFETEKEAKERELWWKSSSGRNKLKEIFKKHRL